MQKRTLPTRSLLQGCAYTSAANTDLRQRFEAIRRQAQQQAPVLQLRSKRKEQGK
jgi:hypothetical protein